jgi:hypothetical protein
MRESNIEKTFVRRVKERGWRQKKLEAGRVSNGWPDRLICLSNGLTVFIEFKAPGKKLTRLQAHVHSELKALRQNVFTCDNAAEALAICEDLNRREGPSYETG